MTTSSHAMRAKMPSTFRHGLHVHRRAYQITLMTSFSKAFKPRRSKTVSGLTLIELLVAITVLAVVAVLGWRGLDGIVRSRVALTQEMERTRGIQIAFAQMQRDAANLASQDLLPNRPPLSAGGGRLLFIRKVFAENQTLRLQVVSYRISNGILYRRESIPTRDLATIDLAWQAGGVTNNEQEVALENGVSQMSLRFWQSNANAWQTVDINSPQIFPSVASSPPAQVTQAITPGNLNNPSQPITGLEVTLQMARAADARMVKVFLLGAS
ncbi:PulJ/GspJ family protein [Noviherbaspirillum pedocola]|nr:prepilin-type N-terminal cleavage/methylation domain-containing protein [Noviherbaspirillum pedocola]